MNLLKEISIGFHYFIIANIIRNLKFINGVLTNAEVWFPLNETYFKELKKQDKILLRKFLEVPVSTPSELLYLETGNIPILDIIKSRRIMYLHYIMTSPQNALQREIGMN